MFKVQLSDKIALVYSAEWFREANFQKKDADIEDTGAPVRQEILQEYILGRTVGTPEWKGEICAERELILGCRVLAFGHEPYGIPRPPGPHQVRVITEIVSVMKRVEVIQTPSAQGCDIEFPRCIPK